MELTVLTPSEALDAFKLAILNGAVAGKRSREPRMQTADMREMDMVGPQGASALRKAVAEGSIQLASVQGVVEHPEPAERSKTYLPESERVAWTEPVELKVAAVRVGAVGEEGGGLIWLIQELVEGRFTQGSMFGQGKDGTLHGMRNMTSAIPSAPEVMRTLASPEWSARLLALRESQELDKNIGPGHGSAAPRM